MNVSDMEAKIDWLKYKWIIFSAIGIRLVAVIFSQGYGMHDDHFLIIEASTSWVDGYDYNNWLPWTEGNKGPDGHSFSYVGLNYIYFLIMKFLGIVDPKILMLFNRLIHAALSMIIVIYGIKITRKFSSEENAVRVGWLLALTWAIPLLSVRNLVETAASPLLILGFWYLIREKGIKDYLWAGLLIGFAVSFRYQIGIFAIGLAAYYFFQWKWKPFLLFCSGVVMVFLITQGVVDYMIWGYPFAEMLGYIIYNMEQGTEYMPNHNYFMYFMVLAGAMLFPFGVLMMTGFFKSWKKYFILFMPTLLFILFHTLYPNRQERFILTILPFFIILGVLGYDLYKTSPGKEKLWKFSWIAFWVLNIPMLFIASTTYTKKSRVESMYAIYDNGKEANLILCEGTGNNSTSMLPRFYCGNWNTAMVDRTDTTQSLNVHDDYEYDYIYFFADKNLNERVSQYKTIYPKMTLLKKCHPSLIDALMKKLNPRNVNEYIEVWETNAK